MVSDETTPQLLNAAKQGFRFTNHRAVSGWTGSNIVSLLSGLSPFDTGVHTRGQSIDPDLILPLEQLGRNDYAVQGLQPFMAVDLYKNLGLELSSSVFEPKLWMATKKKAKQPFFLWYHYLNTHLPYKGEILEDSPLSLETREKLEKVRTQATIHYNEADFTVSDISAIKQLLSVSVNQFDRWFGHFWSFFIQGGFFRNTILIVTADHGDEHGERGMVGHASTTLAGHLHEEIVKVPLFIWLPNTVSVNAIETNRPSSHLDIIKTILLLTDINPHHDLEGHNLLLPKRDNRWFGMTSSGGFNEPDPDNIRFYAYSYIEDNWKLHLRIDNNSQQEQMALYNLNTDPLELNNLAPTHAQLFKRLRDELYKKILTKTQHSTGSPERDESKVSDLTNRPQWLIPSHSGSYSFEQLQGELVLRWTGDAKNSYILEYIAGIGNKQITGTLEVKGNMKDFGKLDRYFWETWIVPKKQFQLRVKKIDQTLWSPWLTLRVQL